MKIIDCFPFLNELELLELRLMELYDTVDWFILAEANKTHTGNPKQYLFAQNMGRFKPYLDKIIYIPVPDLPDSSPDDMWIAENFQRNAISRGLDKVASPGDRVLLSDIDEIPRVEAIEASAASSDLIVFHQKLFYYYVNCQVRRNWRGTVMVTYGSYDTLQQVRNVTKHRGGNVCQNGGWHYSYLTGCDPDKLLYKAQNIVDLYSHYPVGSIEEVERKIKAHEDIYGRMDDWRMKMKIVDITDDKPRKMGAWLRKYPQFFCMDGTDE